MKPSHLKYLRFFIGLLVLVVAGVAVRNKILLDRCARDAKIQKARWLETKETAQKVEDAVIKAHYASMIHLGKTLTFGNMEQIFPASSVTNTKSSAPHPKLLMVFSELSCNVCQDEETRFGVGIANEYGPDYVRAIVYATRRQYVANYIRMNQINFPVFFCQDETFLKENGIKNTPMIFVMDEKNRVIASHFPIPGHLQYSEPIHRFCYHYFNRMEP